MADQSQATPKEPQFKQVTLWETYVLQLAPKKVQVLDIVLQQLFYLGDVVVHGFLCGFSCQNVLEIFFV